MESNTQQPELKNAYWFAAFNALSFQIVLGSPMVLFAKDLGASATVLGIIAGMMPLLVICQIPAANYIDRVGYKRFVLAGWGIRVIFIFAMALVPVLGGWLSPGGQLGLILVLLFGFNVSRGISSSAWLPWITLLVPAQGRGRYLARDAAVVNSASFATLLVAAVALGAEPTPARFAAIFAFSAVTGAISLSFLRRIPNMEVPEHVRSSSASVPYGAMLRYPPFRKLLWMVLAWAVAGGGLTTFTVAFLKVEAGISEGMILAITSVAFLGGLSSLWVLGARLDRLGSKPVLALSFAVWIAVVLGWMLLAGKVIAPMLGFILLLQFLMGLGASAVGMANTRLVMAIVPEMGRNHFFALYSVILNVTLGLSPILWGVLIDSVRSVALVRHGLEWNRYSIFFAAVALSFAVAIGLAGRLHEPQAARLDELFKRVLMNSTGRFLLKFWPRQ
jgi:MFS family permease